MHVSKNSHNLMIYLIMAISINLSCKISIGTENYSKSIDPPSPQPHIPIETLPAVTGTSYFVDFENGNDANNGLSPGEAWRHAPGDEYAGGQVLNIELTPGDAVYFKGGVHYYGNIRIPFSGTADDPVWYIGDEWGAEKAIINGASLLTGWTASPENESIFYTDLPAEYSDSNTTASINLQEYSQASGSYMQLWTAQMPDPSNRYWYDNHHDFRVLPQEHLTLTSITDNELFSQDDPSYWSGSSLLIWTNPNQVVLREITGYSPEEYTVYFDSLHDNAIYPDGRDQYFAVYNSLHALDQPGEYYADFNNMRVYLYPREPENIESSIQLSAREYGIDINSRSGIVVQGFEVINHGGEDLRSGVAIGTVTGTSSENSNIVIRNNEIYNNSHPESGYGGVYITNGRELLIENNLIKDNPQHRGIFVTASRNVTVRDNTITRSGGTSLCFYTVLDSIISGNTISESRGGHANGITIYIASNNILVAANKVIDSNTPVTFQDSGNLYFFNNLIYSADGGGINEWGRTTRGPWSYGKIYAINNTCVITDADTPAFSIGSSRDSTAAGDGKYVPPNSYLQLNNIIDGGGLEPEDERDHNIYTSLAWNQRERYDWFLAEHEMIEDVLSDLFNDPWNGDFSLFTGSPARSAGINPLEFLPAALFPAYDFYTDIDGNPRPQAAGWSIGVYE